MSEIVAKLRASVRSLPRPDLFFVGALITLAILLMVLIGLFYMPFEPTAMSPDRLQGVSLQHLMGTDKMGRDVFSRVMYGSRITLLVALGTMVIGAGTGILIGAITGFYGGVTDEIVMRVMDARRRSADVLEAVHVELMRATDSRRRSTDALAVVHVELMR